MNPTIKGAQQAFTQILSHLTTPSAQPAPAKATTPQATGEAAHQATCSKESNYAARMRAAFKAMLSTQTEAAADKAVELEAPPKGAAAAPNAALAAAAIPLPAATEQEAEELLQQLDNHKETSPAEQRALLDKTAAFLTALPEPVQAQLAHKSAKPAPGATHAHAPAGHTPTPALPMAGVFGPRMRELEALEKEHADLIASQGDKHSPVAMLKAKDIEMRMAMQIENMMSLIKMLADLNKRANEIANGAI